MVERPTDKNDAQKRDGKFSDANPEHFACAISHLALSVQIVLSALLFLGGVFSGVRGFERLGYSLHVGLGDRRLFWRSPLYLGLALAGIAAATLAIGYWAAIRPDC
jgi:hypothetical protein